MSAVSNDLCFLKSQETEVVMKSRSGFDDEPALKSLAKSNERVNFFPLQPFCFLPLRYFR